MNAVLIVALFAVAQPKAATLPKAMQLPMARQMSDDYAFYRNLAIAQGKPIAYFIGIDKRPIAGMVVARLDKLDGYPTRSIVIGVPDPTLGLAWQATLSADATDTQIRKAAAPVVRPFFKRFQDNRTDRLEGRLLRRIADGEPHARQLPTWLTGVKRYYHAENTQAIATTNNAPSIDVVPRTALERHWQFPGGLDTVGGWDSDLYRSVPFEPKQVQKMLPVINSFKNIQYELGWYRSYPDGTWFADVLSTDGNVFEIRVREKNEGRWDSYVAYRNWRYYPPGYVPVKSSQCANCHDKAGTGGYAVGLVSGSDTVISDPFDSIQ